MSDSKYPISDMGADFQPDAMEDFDKRVASGEFADMSMEQIRSVYVQEEVDAVEQQETDDLHHEMDLQDQADLDRELDGNDDDD